ncbi:alpha/beta fold hydrolase [Pseudonocardia sp. ICBG1293]|uniref:alpha/beta fold hydrolase n=1 Tax=Pseudonocardia sp. ICBG1293 TaxID=2844382 RepID=UPI001CCC40F5|nr:alpha/beta hydrolase [Pseudonocardia sp. ICBG1293]
MTTTVFVHGVPETSAIWTPVLAELAELGHHDVVRLSPPGFGAEVPTGFEATVDGYRDWLARELARFDGPVDLVGHDFGGGHTTTVAMDHPELLRSWVTDVLGVFEPDYVWHPQAQIWQTPGDGEHAVAQLVGAPVAERAAALVGLGIPEPIAGEVAAGQDERMGEAILSLYRSAVQPALVHRGRNLPAAAPHGLAVIATHDQAVGSVEQRRRAAARAGARTVVLDGLGHWWMLQDPVRAARALDEFWSSLPA